MGMTTTLTLAYEGAPACVDCQRLGVPVCAHVGFNTEAWDYLIGQARNFPGLDPAFEHTVRNVEISSDRKTVTLTVDTDRPAMLELARHMSTLTDSRAKAAVRAVHHESGETLAEGRYFDAFLQPGQSVHVNGVPHVVVGEPEHPNRNEYGIATEVDVQLVRLMPTPVEPVQTVPSGGAA